MSARVVHVRVPGAAHDVTIGPGVLDRLGGIAAGLTASRAALLAVDERIAAGHGERAIASLREAGFTPISVRLIAEERHKTLDAVRRVYQAMLSAGGRFERGSPVVALGGGIVGDLAGFAAATFLRGVPLVQAPTTLLAMVDAAIGGKTGVNVDLPGGGLGKNMIGAVWQPRAVLSDTRLLATLPARDFRCGLAECVKSAMIADEGLLGFLEEQAEAILRQDPEVLVALIERCVRIKAAIVEEDERESGRRMLLNLGHTFAHAIESRENGLKHGEAVSIGLAAASECAVRGGRLSEPQRQRIVRLLERLGLPLRLPASEPAEALLRAMRYDKKVAAGRVRLVLPEGLGAARLVDDVTSEAVLAAWSAVGAK
jgi:3-dehydroquinate synthase